MSMYRRTANKRSCLRSCAGLDPKAAYRVQVLGQTTAQEWSGAYLMQNGVSLRLVGDYDSTAVLLERE
ncbi:MAG: GH36 C-terminal domain-containing protein [Bryobacteraceae bacterium]